MGRRWQEPEPVVCPECGSRHDVVCRGCGSLWNELPILVDQLRVEKRVLQDDNLKLGIQIRRLRANADRQLIGCKEYPDAIEVLEFWKEILHPAAVELSGERLKGVIDRLRGGYTKEQLKECVLGYSKMPYVVNGRGRVPHGTPAQRRVDAELLFRDPQHVDQGRAYAKQATAHRQAFASTIPQPATTVTEVDLGKIGNAALRYAKLGWWVFPCKADGKEPKTAHGLLDAAPDVGKVIAHWSKAPRSNVAVRTGRESEIVVLDVDGDEGIETLHRLEKEHEPLPKTGSVVTPRGGEHFYFAHPGRELRNTQGVPGPGIDFRGDGGYVLAPPSQVNGKPYEVDNSIRDFGIQQMPEWLVNMLVNYQSRVGGRVDPHLWEQIVQKGVKEGERNGQLTRLTGYLLYHLPDQGVVLGIVKNTNKERCKPPLPDREVEKIVESVIRKNEREAA